ncbi:MAG: hypothetical protein JW818_23315 [Pirellulales bacterium]|nr:hypothetical protein [Pirellulales bacterium]
MTDPAVLFGIARQLWEPGFTGTLSQRVDQLDSLNGTSHVVSLARTVPVDRVRARLRACCVKHFDEGPGGLLSKGRGSQNSGGGVFGMGMGAEPSNMEMEKEIFLDPGLIVVVKSALREKSTRSPRKTRTKTTQPTGDLGGPSIAANPRDQWKDATESLVMSVCRHCAAAAQNGAGQQGGSEADSPIKPHARAVISTQYNLAWPRDASTKLGGFQVDPLKVKYLRIEEDANPLKLLRYYSRTMDTKHREIGNNEGAWYSALKDSGVPGRKTSIDVLITRPSGGGPPAAAPGPTRGRNEEPTEPLVVEILTVEINDPAGA